MDSSEWIGTSLGLKLDDGRVLGITIVDADGKNPQRRPRTVEVPVLLSEEWGI